MAKIQYQIPDELFDLLRSRVAACRAASDTTNAEYMDRLRTRAITVMIKDGQKGLDALNLDLLAMNERIKYMTIGSLVKALLATVVDYTDEELAELMVKSGVFLGRPPIQRP